MKKFILLVLICFVQNAFSQNTKQQSKTKTSTAKSTETPIIKVNTRNYSDADLTVDDKPTYITQKDDNAVYNTAGIEVKPEFPGGYEAMNAFIKQNFKSPEEDLKGKIYATFIIEKDGSLSDIKILRDLGHETSAEAIRVLKLFPKWSPGKQNDKIVRVLYSIPMIIN
ncbi:energy transducer TonB [Flavobacterium sp. ASV13]|uniref:energy transducer TonB n=1 Tax=Flavobacterium sp. ASV13 TaxID=1506583 RepID=UPI0006903BDD|nr:energy transducer TonB [Flavobacterium sp. ASV13]